MSVRTNLESVESYALARSRLLSAQPTQTGYPRDLAMDFTKGALVLCMVLYHWLNYFIGPEGQYYSYLRFLTPSFIFITGFMISQIHLRRYQANGRNLAKRLTVRGFKLLAVFLFLNIVVSVGPRCVPMRFAGLEGSLRTLCWAFIVANPLASEGRKGASFTMLVPIAYLLILSAGVIMLTRDSAQQRNAFRYTCVALIAAVVLSYTCRKANSYLDLLMIGSLGIVIGFARKEQIARVLDHPKILSAVYCGYLAVITVWGVSVPLQVASVILTTALLYIVGSRGRVSRAGQRHVILLGKYSLLGYISQIAILQGLRRVSLLSHYGVGGLLACLLLGFLLTVVVVGAVDVATRKSRLVYDMYQLVFA